MGSNCRSANCKMTKWKIVAICGTALLIAAAVVVALREQLQPVPLPEVPVAQTPAEVRVKAVERNSVAATTTAAFDASWTEGGEYPHEIRRIGRAVGAEIRLSPLGNFFENTPLRG